MTMDNIDVLIFYFAKAAFMILFIVLLVKTVRIVPEDQRLAIRRLGRYLGAKGPGVVFTIPYMDIIVKVKMGAAGILNTEETMIIGKEEVPVQVLDGSPPGSPVAIQGFNRETILVANAPAQELDH